MGSLGPIGVITGLGPAGALHPKCMCELSNSAPHVLYVCQATPLHLLSVTPVCAVLPLAGELAAEQASVVAGSLQGAILRRQGTLVEVASRDRATIEVGEGG